MNVTPSTTTVPQLVPLPDTKTAVLVASLEQVSDPVGTDGSYATANDQAVLAAIKEGWDILVDTQPVEREDGSTAYVTVFTR